MPLPPHDRPVDLSRSECRLRDARKRQLQADLLRWRDRLQHATSLEEREQIVRTMDGLEDSIQILEDELSELGCYSPGEVPPSLVIRVDSIEVTQAIQHHRQRGTGATPNSVPLVALKSTLCRVYVENGFHQESVLSGRIIVMAWNHNSLKYDIFRRELQPQNPHGSILLAATKTSDRARLENTLNFNLPAEHCNERLRLDVEAWVEAHRGDPSYTGKGSQEVEFNTRRSPIIHCHRYDLTPPVPGAPAVTYAAPSDAACRNTMDFAARVLPISSLDIRDRGTRPFNGRLQNDNDYDAILTDIQTVRAGTTPTPAEHEIYLAMIPTHNSVANVLGTAGGSAIWSTVGIEDTFAHELAHLLLPGDDHVFDNACAQPGVVMDHIDPNYPDYPNTPQRAGIGEFGVDLGRSPFALFGPDTADLMSYCRPRWISPYNYTRAFRGDLLNPFDDRAATPADAQKLLVSFRLHREGTAEFKWALHLPGAVPKPSAKNETDLVLETQQADGSVLAAIRCHIASDRPAAARYTDFLEILPWVDSIARLVLMRDGQEIASWAVEDAAPEPAVRDLSTAPTVRADGAAGIRISWQQPRARTKLHQMLRYTPDDGRTWIPLANGIEGDAVEIAGGHLRGARNCRFQLVTSSGFRTTLVETSEGWSSPETAREVEIIEPARDAVLMQGQPVRLVGRTSMWLDGRDDAIYAYWTSNRDGHLADGLRPVVGGLSAGRHVIRLIVDDGHAEVSDRILITVNRAG